MHTVGNEYGVDVKPSGQLLAQSLRAARDSIRQVDFERGGFEAQYGNALSGIINISTREGGTDLRGALEYRTSELAGALGSDADDLLGANLLQGYVSGPIPGTQEKLRFAISGREDQRASRILEFDDEVYNPQFESSF